MALQPPPALDATGHKKRPLAGCLATDERALKERVQIELVTLTKMLEIELPNVATTTAVTTTMSVSRRAYSAIV
jgi:hypothetical protein